MSEKKEKRTERKTLPLTLSEFAAFTAAANASGLPLTTWLVQAAREKLARDESNNEVSEVLEKIRQHANDIPKDAIKNPLVCGRIEAYTHVYMMLKLALSKPAREKLARDTSCQCGKPVDPRYAPCCSLEHWHDRFS